MKDANMSRSEADSEARYGFVIELPDDGRGPARIGQGDGDIPRGATIRPRSVTDARRLAAWAIQEAARLQYEPQMVAMARALDELVSEHDNGELPNGYQLPDSGGIALARIVLETFARDFPAAAADANITTEV